MGYNICTTAILIISLAISTPPIIAITNRYPRTLTLPLRVYANPATSPALPDWEAGLREATFLTLLKEHRLSPALRGYILSAPLVGRQNNVTPFGDVAIVARGQLYSTRGGFQFVQDRYQNDCIGCHNNVPPTACQDGADCEQWQPFGHERLLALWTVKRIRHRDPNYGLRYQLEYTISPMKIPPPVPIPIRYGQFDYNVPGHTYVVALDPKTAEIKLQTVDTLSNKISNGPSVNLQDASGWSPIAPPYDTQQYLPPPKKVLLNTGEFYYQEDRDGPKQLPSGVPTDLLPPDESDTFFMPPPPRPPPTIPNYIQPPIDPRDEERLLIQNLIQVLAAKTTTTTIEPPLFPPDESNESASISSTDSNRITSGPRLFAGATTTSAARPSPMENVSKMRFPAPSSGASSPRRKPDYYSDSDVRYSEPDPLFTTITPLLQRPHPVAPSMRTITTQQGGELELFETSRTPIVFAQNEERRIGDQGDANASGTTRGQQQDSSSSGTTRINDEANAIETTKKIATPKQQLDELFPSSDTTTTTTTTSVKPERRTTTKRPIVFPTRKPIRHFYDRTTTSQLHDGKTTTTTTASFTGPKSTLATKATSHYLSSKGTTPFRPSTTTFTASKATTAPSTTSMTTSKTTPYVQTKGTTTTTSAIPKTTTVSESKIAETSRTTLFPSTTTTTMQEKPTAEQPKETSIFGEQTTNFYTTTMENRLSTKAEEQTTTTKLPPLTTTWFTVPTRKPTTTSASTLPMLQHVQTTTEMHATTGNNMDELPENVDPSTTTQSFTSKRVFFTPRPTKKRKYTLPTKSVTSTTTTTTTPRDNTSYSRRTKLMETTTRFSVSSQPVETTFTQPSSETTTQTRPTRTTTTAEPPTTSPIATTNPQLTHTTMVQTTAMLPPQNATEMRKTTQKTTLEVSHRTTPSADIPPSRKPAAIPDFDLFGPPTQDTTTTTTNPHPTLHVADNIGDVFGANNAIDTHANNANNNNEDLFAVNNTPKIIYSNFYVPDEPDDSDYTETQTIRAEQQPTPTEQSYSTSISVQIGEGNRTHSVDVEENASVSEVKGREKNENVKADLTARRQDATEQLDNFALSILNHAKGIEYFNSVRAKAKRNGYVKSNKRARARSN